MAYHGRIKNGVIVLDEPVPLPEGTEVAVDILAQTGAEAMHPDIPRFTGILPAELNPRESYYQGLLEKHR
jgi:hypothetical protein